MPVSWPWSDIRNIILWYNLWYEKKKKNNLFLNHLLTCQDWVKFKNFYLKKFKKSDNCDALHHFDHMPFYFCVVASSSGHFSHEYATRERKKGRSSQVFRNGVVRPNKEILDKSREVFAVRRSCLHYSREYSFGYLALRFSFCLAGLSLSVSYH